MNQSETSINIIDNKIFVSSFSRPKLQQMSNVYTMCTKFSPKKLYLVYLNAGIKIKDIVVIGEIYKWSHISKQVRVSFLELIWFSGFRV